MPQQPILDLNINLTLRQKIKNHFLKIIKKGIDLNGDLEGSK